MKPLFTIHAGEYLAGTYIEENFKNCRVWIPSKDTGIDLLVTNRRNTSAVSLQVKFSKDFTHSHMADFYKDKLVVSTWFKFDRSKIESSQADLWLFAFRPFAEYAPRFMLIQPRDLLRRIQKIHGTRDKYDLYFTITKQDRCFETRGLKEMERREIIQTSKRQGPRDFTVHLDNWAPVEKLNKGET
ncbi:hypothetical protein BH09VER1_BH09VER1_23830 [soil metagenome]